MRSRFQEMFSSGFVPTSEADCSVVGVGSRSKDLYKDGHARLKTKATSRITETFKEPMNWWTGPVPTTAEFVAPRDEDGDIPCTEEASTTWTGAQQRRSAEESDLSSVPAQHPRGRPDTLERQFRRSRSPIVISKDTITATEIRARRQQKIACIAGMLFRTIVEEIKVHGLLVDYVGYPYRTKQKDSAWDGPDDHGDHLCMGTHQELFEEAIILLWSDLRQRGFVVHELSYREERIRFLTREHGRRTRKGIGLAWNLE